MSRPAKDPAPGSGDEVLVGAEDLSAGYGNKVVLRDVDFEVGAGRRVAVLGSNGGGKTTLFRVLLGEIEPFSGSATTASRCGIVPQSDRSRLDFPVSALDVALMGTVSRMPWWRRPGRAERRQARAALDEVGMASLAERTFGDLSGGQRQRVLVARALVQDARIILLDEPFTGMDTISADRMEALLEKLADQGRSLLIATHDLEQARSWDLVLCLNGRQIAFGIPAEVLTPTVIAETYGAAVVALEEGGERVIVPPHHHDHHDAG